MTFKTLAVSTTLAVLGGFGAVYAPAAKADDCYVYRYRDSWGRPYDRVVCYPTRYYSSPYRSYSYSTPRSGYYDSHTAWHSRNDRRLIDRDPWSNRNWQYDHQRWHDRNDGRRYWYR